MAIYHEDIVDIELMSGNVFRSFRSTTIGCGDDDANRFGIRALRDGFPENLGGTCAGYFIRADGQTVVIADGVVDGNLAYVTLPEACYAVEGNFTLAIKVSGGGITGTMRIVDGVVSRTSTSATVDPGTLIPSVEDLLDAIEEAVESIPADYTSLWTSIAPAFSTGTMYEQGDYCTYNGKAWRFCKDHSGTWNADDVFEVKVLEETEKINDAFGGFAGLNPAKISTTLAATDTTVNFTDIKLFAGIKYLLYVTEAVPTTNKINFYAAGDTTNYCKIVQGWNEFTPAIDGYVRIYNGNAQYAGNLHIEIVSTGRFMTGEQQTILTNAQLSALTKGTNSCNDFPSNSIVCYGSSDASNLTDAPNNSNQNNLGTYVTFDHRGAGNAKAGKAQIFIHRHGTQFAYRECWGSESVWGEWHSTFATQKSYLTREDWLADYSLDQLAYLPQMTLYCFASGTVNPSDAPYANFTGTVMTIGYRSRAHFAEPGDYQIAFALNDTIWYRRYIYNANGNYWSAWFCVTGEKEYHVGTGYAYTSLHALLYDLKNDVSKKVIYLHDGTYDIFAEYKAEITAGHMTEPPDTVVTSDYLQYSIFVPSGTRIVGLGNVTLKMTPEAEDVTIGESYMWSPLNISGSVELENLIVLGHNCRYCMHNDDHGAVPQAHQHYKNCRFIYTWSDEKNGTRLGYNNTIGFGLSNGSTHTFDDCEIVFDGPGNHSAYYGHENNSGKNGTLILRNCIIRATDFTNNRVIRLQTLGTGSGYVRAYFEGCYVNGGLQLDLYNSESRNNFEATFVNCNKLPVSRYRSSAPSVAVTDPYTVRWFNPLPTPTAQAPQYEEDSL